MDEKELDLKAIAIMIYGFQVATKDDVDDFFDRLPTKEGGPKLTRQELHEWTNEGFEWLYDKLREKKLELPEVTDDDLKPDEPDVDVLNQIVWIFEMTHQHALDEGHHDCGFWFDSAELIIMYDGGRYSHVQRGNLMIKKSPHRTGRFTAELSSIPASAKIISAKLIMNLNRAEGIAYADDTGVVKVTDGLTKEFIREITAAEDIKGKGYSKHNPRVPVDFTDFVKKIRGQ